MIIAVTGFMGAGKTTATQFFPKSWKRISADSLGHTLLKDPSIIKRLTAAFGREILHRNKIIMSVLAKKVFSTKKNLKLLNTIIHPALRQKIIQEIASLKKKKKNAVLDCALVHELQLRQIVDYNILITAPLALCIKRAKDWNKKEVVERTRHQKQFQNPDFIIVNTGSKNDLKKAIGRIVTALEHSQQ